MQSKPPLTQKRERWARNRDVALRGNKLLYNASQQEKYQRELEKLVNQMTRDVQYEIEKLFKSQTSKDYFKKQKEASIALDASISSQARILMNALTSKFTQLFDKKSKSLAEKMLSGALSTSKANLYASLKKLSGGLSLKTGVVTEGVREVSKSIVSENVSLITSIPQKYLDDVSGSVYRSITTGEGIKTLIPEIEKYKGITQRRAKNIALDQTRKAYNTINKQRMQQVGIKQFEWIHSGGGQTPRESHLNILDGKKFSFENLRAEQAALGVPEKDRGLPGEPINCRCTILPIIDFNQR